MSRVARAGQLQQMVEAALAAAGITATVSVESQGIEDGLFHGPVVCIQPPDVDFTTYSQAELEWELFIISGPQDDRVEAWRRIDQVIDALEVPMSLLTAKPAHYGAGDRIYPAYVVTTGETSVRDDVG